MLRHVTSGSLAFVPLKLTGRNDLPPFPATLTTRALYPCSLWWFGACPCRPAPGGRPPSPIKLRSVLCRDKAFTAHNLLVLDGAPGEHVKAWEMLRPPWRELGLGCRWQPWPDTKW